MSGRAETRTPEPPAYCCIRLTFLRIEFQGNSTYKGDETLKPDEHRDPSGMLPGSLSFFPD
ncbi:hypothetical protein KXX47_006928, partial [Aspergillus fumigatus]